MTLTTRCPACSTSFRVTPQQLQARQGTVRCGRCATVFNALDNLATLPVAPETPEAAPAAPVGAGQMPATPFPEEPLVFETTHLDLDVTAVPPAAPSSPETEDAVADLEHVAEPRQPAEEDLALSESPPDRRRDLAWGIGALLLLVVLAGQVMYLLRTEAAAMRPGLRPILEGACGFFGCSVPLPRRPEKWSIDSSDLQAEPGRVNVMTLSAVLRNRAPYLQAYPALELTLDDTAGRPVGRRVLTAEDYLPKDADPRQGAPANGEVVVRLMMDTGDLDAAGYRLFLFYPPASVDKSSPAAGG